MRPKAKMKSPNLTLWSGKPLFLMWPRFRLAPSAPTKYEAHRNSALSAKRPDAADKVATPHSRCAVMYEASPSLPRPSAACIALPKLVDVAC